MDIRDRNGRFTKGNPGGGRPKKRPTTKDLLQALTPEAVTRLGELIHSDETGDVMHLALLGQKDESTGIYGIDFPYGATGIASLGDGSFYFSMDFSENDTWGTEIGLFRFDGNNFLALT